MYDAYTISAAVHNILKETEPATLRFTAFSLDMIAECGNIESTNELDNTVRIVARDYGLEEVVDIALGNVHREFAA